MEEEYKYNCDQCNYHTNVLNSYEKHTKSTLHITGKRKARSDKKNISGFKCDVCGYKSNNEFNYKGHYLNNHGTKEEKKKEFKYYCECCDFGTFVDTCYNLHIETKKHNTKKQNKH